MEGKKPIAERLREACKSEPFRNDRTYDIKVGEIYVNLSWEEASNLADEIEAEQKAIIEAQGGAPAGVIKVWADNSDIPMEDGEGIPAWLKRNFAKLPCDKAGEPWHIGDETDKGRISGFTVHELYPVPRVLIHKHGMDHHATAFDPRELERVEEEPVLDADGVEIKVGDTVWHLRTGDEFIVESLPVDDRVNLLLRGNVEGIGEINTSWYAPHEVTHEQPVFDADGVRICKGDMVWSKLDEFPRPMTVLRPYPYNRVYCELDGNEYEFLPEQLTHREPDSRNKVESELSEDIVSRIDELVKQGRWLND